MALLGVPTGVGMVIGFYLGVGSKRDSTGRGVGKGRRLVGGWVDSAQHVRTMKYTQLFVPEMQRDMDSVGVNDFYQPRSG